MILIFQNASHFLAGLARIAWAVLNKGRAFTCVKTDAMASRPT
jgi:hypothetical protein